MTDKQDQAPSSPAVELTRYRQLPAFWTALVQIFGALAVLLAINQLYNFNLGGALILLDNQYYYLLLALLVPLSFLVFPAGRRAADDRVPWYDIALFALTLSIAIYLAVRGRAIIDGGWEY